MFNKSFANNLQKKKISKQKTVEKSKQAVYLDASACLSVMSFLEIAFEFGLRL